MSLCVFGVIAIFQNKYTIKNRMNVLMVLLFFGYYGLMKTFESGSILNGIINAALMMVVSLFILSCETKYLLFIAKKICAINVLFCIFGIGVFAAYFFDSAVFNRNSSYIMHSDVGDTKIQAQSIYDYFCFTSGDGFDFFGTQIMRVKGYCNEPSATIPHYIGPITLMFLCKRISYLWAIIAIAFSFFCIASGVGIVIVLCAIGFYFIIQIKSKALITNIIVICSLIVAVGMLYSDVIINSITIYGGDVYQQTNYDLILRKQESAATRLQSYSEAVSSIIAYPFGGSGMITMTGLWTTVGLAGGIILLPIYFGFVIKIVKLAVATFIGCQKIKIKMGIALMLSTVIIATCLSSYGWARIPGVILFFLYYRFLCAELEEIKRKSKKQLRFKNV